MRVSICLAFPAAILAAPLASHAQEPEPAAIEAQADDFLAAVRQAKTICAAQAQSNACKAAQARSVAIVANAVAEAGRSGDRATFIDPVRKLLTAGDPEVRAAAIYALAKFGPEAADTTAIRALARDPISLVRAGAWSAARRSSDPAARRIAERFDQTPRSGGTRQDPEPFAPALLGLQLPAGAEFLWLAAARRELGELAFVTAATPDETAAYFAASAGSEPKPLSSVLGSPLDGQGRLFAFSKPNLFGDPKVLVLSDGQRDPGPARFAVVYRDLAFEVTGFALVWEDGQDLRPKMEPASTVVIEPSAPLGDKAFDAALLHASGAREDADQEDTDLFMAVKAAGGFGAEDYLALFPDGAYAEEARAYLTHPRLKLDAISYSETSDIKLRFDNLPPESAANIQIESVADAHNVVASTYTDNAGATETVLDPYNDLRPGVYVVRAEVGTPGHGADFVLTRDFSVTGAVAALTLDKSDYAPDEAITITFAGMSGASDDYLSTAEIGTSNSVYLKYVYTKGAREGTATLQAPTKPGEYEVRAFYREDESVVRGRAPFRVVQGGGPPAPAATPPAPTQTAAAVAHPAPTPSPAPASGDPYANFPAPVIRPAKPIFAANEAIVFRVSGLPGKPTDWVSVVPKGMADTGHTGSWQYTKGKTEGEFTLYGQRAGSYEIRVYFDDPVGGKIVRARTAIEVK